MTDGLQGIYWALFTGVVDSDKVSVRNEVTKRPHTLSEKGKFDQVLDIQIQLYLFGLINQWSGTFSLLVTYVPSISTISNRKHKRDQALLKDLCSENGQKIRQTASINFIF